MKMLKEEKLKNGKSTFAIGFKKSTPPRSHRVEGWWETVRWATLHTHLKF